MAARRSISRLPRTATATAYTSMTADSPSMAMSAVLVPMSMRQTMLMAGPRLYSSMRPRVNWRRGMNRK